MDKTESARFISDKDIKMSIRQKYNRCTFVLENLPTMKLALSILGMLASSILSQAQVKAAIMSAVAVPDYSIKSCVELPSGNMIYFASDQTGLGVVKTTSNFHVIESHKHITDEFTTLLKAKLIGDKIYLLGEQDAYQPGGLQIVMADTNGYIIKMAKFPNVIPNYFVYNSLEVFPMDSNYIGVATSNNGLLEILKVPADLNINISIEAIDILPLDFPATYYNLMGLSVAEGNLSFVSLDSSGTRVYNIQIFPPDLSISNMVSWLIPTVSNSMYVNGVGPISSFSRFGGSSVTICYENKMFGLLTSNANPTYWSAEILPTEYTITNCAHSDSGGYIINAIDQENSMPNFYVGYKTQADNQWTLYNNDLVQKNNIKNNIVTGFTQSYGYGLEVEWFHVDDIETCRDIENSYSPNIIMPPFEAWGLTTPVSNRIGQVYNSPATISYYTEVAYLCDPNSLSVEENNDVNSVSVFPNPSSSFVQIESKEPIKTVTVIDLSGKIVKTINQGFQSIPVEDLQDGLYIFRVQTSKSMVTKKVVVEK